MQKSNWVAHRVQILIMVKPAFPNYAQGISLMTLTFVPNTLIFRRRRQADFLTDFRDPHSAGHHSPFPLSFGLRGGVGQRVF